MKVSVVVPLYNEEKTIVNILSKIQDEIKKLDKKILPEIENDPESVN